MNRDEALRAHEENNPEWLDLAEHAVTVIAERYRYFTTDRVWRLLDRFGAGSATDNRAMGAAIKRCLRAGVIEQARMPADQGMPEGAVYLAVIPTNREVGNRDPKPVYRSLIYRAGQD